MESKKKESHFFATLSRMKYIERWALMRNAREETLSEHSLDVAVIAHALCVLANRRHGHHVDAERAALVGLYHDASEIITGDMPTPVKYGDEQILNAYKGVEIRAEQRLLDLLPEDLREDYEDLFFGGDDAEEIYMRKLVKAADKLSALIKCMEEEEAGNREFRTAKESIWTAVQGMAAEYPEVADFVDVFLPSYGKTLDQLLGRD
ncbi:putative 5'-nucleotidase YfbR [Shuttleworthella sp. MSX8B]|uniref:5'-deoxynucleotidase n=1 Tax=Shuttleworthella sp. MSX8B TaxID=936574 RepID=UPI000446D8A0|nr:5'-deoxynucleotidase [Shuttleworthia sp. MSX8B]EUB15276.1 putative 5'-nucleotidase YfbR [Shuttleworthia sp. MSX8B]